MNNKVQQQCSDVKQESRAARALRDGWSYAVSDGLGTGGGAILCVLHGLKTILVARRVGSLALLFAERALARIQGRELTEAELREIDARSEVVEAVA